MDLDYKNKPIEWYDDFEAKAYSLVLYYYSLRQTKNVIKVAKTFLKVRKEKVNLYGLDDVDKAKLLQLKTIVKTGGLFLKPYPISEIINYKGVVVK